MLDTFATVRLETKFDYRPSRRVVAWSAIIVNFALWAIIVTGAARLLGT